MPFWENLGGLHEEQPAGEVFFHEDIPHVFGEVEQIIKGTGQICTGNLPHKYVVIQPIWESVLQVYGAAAYEAHRVRVHVEFWGEKFLVVKVVQVLVDDFDTCV